MSSEKKNPIPQGKYTPATRFGNLIFTAGMTPRKDGVLQMSCKVKANEPLETYRDAVRLAAANALTAAQNTLGEGESLRVLSFWVYINAEDDFIAHAKLADFASEYLTEELGENGVAARAAIGMGTLPGVAPVEVQLICGAV